MQRVCGGGMVERQEEKKPYQACISCGRVYAPRHSGRPESLEKVGQQDQLDPRFTCLAGLPSSSRLQE